MNILMISDTHNRHLNMNTDDWPKADIILHAGDFSMRGGENEVRSFFDWYSELPYKHKIVIAGNHDLSFQDNVKYVDYIRTTYPGITYLDDEYVVIDEIKIYGSPYTPAFGYGWAFNLSSASALNNEWAKIPKDTNILITHGPAQGYGDKVVRGGHNVGCSHLLEAIESIKPKIHLCGHIHEGYGIYRHSSVDGINFINASLLNEFYQNTNEPILINYNLL